ncbi:MAG: hypothetical protein GKR89_19345 [Candidatus Latescibacteria bacterium]|nr:hypothetical protein [Candidatus Latescibacterota bacterium]
MPTWRELVQFLEHRYAIYFIAAAVAILWWLGSSLLNWVRRLRQQERRQHWMPLEPTAEQAPAPRPKPRRRIPLQ